MWGYIIFCIVLILILAAFIPALIAATKGQRFSRWYFFGVLLFPVALYSSFRLKKPVKYINVRTTRQDKSRVKTRFRKTDKKVLNKVSPGFISMVFFTKLIFGAFSGLVAFAIARIFCNDTLLLRLTSVVFAILMSMLLSYTEVKRLSLLPLLADEITKRAVMLFCASLATSFPVFIIRHILLKQMLYEHSDFIRFICTVIAFVLFVAVVIRIQRYYYGMFAGFFDYCVLSLCAYCVFAATTLIIYTLSDYSAVLSLIAMPMQLFNLEYFSGVEYLEKISSVYSSAIVHLIVAVLIFLSGIMCYAYKKKELEFRIEYRTKAFRMSQKRVLRRHIPKAGLR